MYKLSITENLISWMAQIIATIIMSQTLYYKFSGAEESIYIFSTVGIEPWGRYGTGIMELIASLLLLFPRSAWAGATIGIGIMIGAIFSHLTLLGISIMNDHGYLFVLALVTLFACTLVLFMRKHQVPIINQYV
jgi:uncharacterized membrane protein YphA (DoxX/SURF4 family)